MRLKSNRFKVNPASHASTTLEMVVSNGFKVRVFHCIFRGHSLGVVVLQHFAQQVNGFVGDKLVVLRGDELGPWLLGVGAEDVVVV